MLYYLTSTGNGCSADGTLPEGAVVCTQEQYQNATLWAVVNGHVVAVTPPPVDTRHAAQAALDRSDITIIRCYEHAVAVPAEWGVYRTALRAIVAGGPTSAALPVQPAYPAGT